MKAKIDKNIPIPKSGRGRKGYLCDLYPFEEMEIGDSFFTDEDGRNFSGKVYTVGKRLNKKFSVAKEGDGCRCWRIK